MTNKPTVQRVVATEQLHTAAAKEAIAQAAEILRAGGTVAFPTETVYGLGANALDADSVAKIFAAKQRPSWDPLIVHICDAEMLARVVAEISPTAQRLMDAFWPGPLTLLLPRNEAIPLAVTAGRDLVGVRMPAHPVAQALIAASGLPIAAPSANRFGHISPTTAAHVLDDLNGRIDMVLDGGPTAHGVESTVLEVREGGAVVYRAGAISMEALQSLIGSVVMYQPQLTTTPPASLPSPGVGIRHYAPRARVVLVDCAMLNDVERERAWLRALSQAAKLAQNTGALYGVLLPTLWPLPDGFSGLRFDWGGWSHPESLAQR
ncbi:MAG TPA: L-threonylcarbamoyladenylate synthase, partial [Acidobacteriaceae bacterium]|nr:L-threonylcarbamoyladenylate synthase [Acidobacteriaceae bacterium]